MASFNIQYPASLGTNWVLSSSVSGGVVTITGALVTTSPTFFILGF